MTRFFLFLFRYFRTHRAVFYAVLAGSSLLFAFFAARIHFQENILDLLPKTDKSKESAVAFGNIRVKDKVFVSLLSRDGKTDPLSFSAAMDDFLTLLSERDEDALVGSVLSGFDADDLMNGIYYAMDALPCHLGADFYPLLDSLAKEEVIDAYVSGDLAPPVAELGAFNLIDGHLFSPDSTLALAFLAPSFPGIDTQAGRKLERLLSGTVRDFEAAHPGFEVLYHGATIEGTFNSQRILSDLIWTVGISLLLICLLICICFKTKSTLLMLVSPVVYGTVFALACVDWIQGEISLIALGIGAIVLGVALSYCLHVLTHHKFVSDVESVIREQARPVILGCLTTIGAFAGLLLTSSSLLRDFGLFASFAMIGTTFFVLAFLPQFFDEGDQVKNEAAFKVIGKINSYPLDRNKPLVALMAVVTIVCICFSGRVGFDSDLGNIGYREPKVVRSEQLYNAKTAGSDFSQYFAAWSRDRDSAIVYSRQLSLVETHTQISKDEGVIGLSSSSLAHPLSTLSSIVLSHSHQTLVSKSSIAVRILSQVVVEQCILGSLVVLAIIHIVQSLQNLVILRISLVQRLDGVDRSQRVSVAGQTSTQSVQLISNGVGLLSGILLGNFQIAIATVLVLSLESIATSEESNLSVVLLLRLVVHSCEERIGTRVNEGTPILQSIGLSLLVSLFLTDVYQVSTNSPNALSILLSILRSNLALSVRLLVIFVTLDGAVDSVTDSISQAQSVVRHNLVGSTTHLNTNLILSDSSCLLGNLLHSQVYQVIVSLGFLRSIGHLVDILLNKLSSIAIDL